MAKLTKLEVEMMKALVLGTTSYGNTALPKNLSRLAIELAQALREAKAKDGPVFSTHNMDGPGVKEDQIVHEDEPGVGIPYDDWQREHLSPPVGTVGQYWRCSLCGTTWNRGSNAPLKKRTQLYCWRCCPERAPGWFKLPDSETVSTEEPERLPSKRENELIILLNRAYSLLQDRPGGLGHGYWSKSVGKWREDALRIAFPEGDTT